MALQTAQALSVTGVAATYSAVSASDTVAANGTVRMVYHVKNAGGSPDTVTLVVPGTDVFGQAIPDVAVTVTNGTEKFIYITDQARAADPSTGLITITHSFTTSVTAAVLTLA
jgi:hypothetical protein